jgi:hypothetical protein
MLMLFAALLSATLVPLLSAAASACARSPPEGEWILNLSWDPRSGSLRARLIPVRRRTKDVKVDMTISDGEVVYERKPKSE